MSMRPATEAELARWDELIAANPDGGMALQTLAWGEFKSRWGWQPRRYIHELNDGRLVAAQWLVRRVPLQGEVWYCPKGPGVTAPADFAEIVAQTRAASLPGVFMRFESEVLDDDLTDKKPLIQFGLVRANRDPGSKSTIFIDLAPSEDGILASFNQSCRRNLRKAQNGGVTVEPVEATPANLDTMFELMKATEARAKYGLRPKAYFLDYWKSQIDAGQAQILLAKHEGEVLAGIFLTYVGARAWYKDGGSFNVKRELNASYLIQWESMRWLKEHGVTSYDMVGTPNRDQVGTGDARDGLYAFKSKFNPEITEFIGCYDLVLNEKKYTFWRKYGERIAGRLASRRPEKFLY
jgi:lipid II:glycine glycyltransferase (peptidoglycan interpeptide bridge formation enzyme)